MMNRKGFTVIELMISAAIFSFVITGLTIALMQQQRQFILTREAVDVDQTARASLDLIARKIRSAVSRQGKTESLRFINGGSTPTGCSTANTTDAGTVNSPPDCITIYTWDITRGQDGEDFPSTPANVSLISTNPLRLQLPDEWFDRTKLIGERAVVSDDILLGFRAPTALCFPNDPANTSSNVNCVETPNRCTECSAVLRATVNGNTKQAEIAGDVDNLTGDIITAEAAQDALVRQNFLITNSEFADLQAFVSNAFVTRINRQSSDMTIVRAETFSIDARTKELQMKTYGRGPFLPIAGGEDAAGIVDLQLVFNLQDLDGRITKVGVPLDAANRRFPDFQAHSSLLGRQKDIRTVEIYLVVRSKLRPRLIRGQRIPTKTIPQIGDVLERRTNRDGFIYRVYSTTVYIRNMSREEFG